MRFSSDDLKRMMARPEAENLEFKEAKNRYDFEDLVEYCVALINEGGGQIVLGVSDKQPRKIVGTKAFDPIQRTKAGLFQRLQMRVEVTELPLPEGRVLIFDCPPRPNGMPLSYKGRYLMRSGEELVAMSNDMLKRILDEATSDYSALIREGASLDDLDPEAIEVFRTRWIKKSGNERLRSLSAEQLLTDSLLIQSGITNAALILLGRSDALDRLMPQCEVIFEYRSTEASGPAQHRESFRRGYLSFVDELWDLVNRRNDLQSFQPDFFIDSLPTFNERVVREAINNALCHRDYSLPGSIFIRQYSRHLVIESPGGFPEGVTPENILWQCVPRNRLLAEAFERCGLVERSGQGVNVMVEEAILDSKDHPDFSRSTSSGVTLQLPGEVRDLEFLRFLHKVDKNTRSSFSTQDLLILDLINRDRPVPSDMKGRLPQLVEKGIIEKKSQNKYILSRGLYSFLGKKGTYTRKIGLDEDTNKALLMKHITDNSSAGSPFSELAQVLPSHSRGQIKRLLSQLKEEGNIHVIGRTRSARWYPGPPVDNMRE